MVGTVPRSLADWMWPFVRCFTGATWDHVLVLVAGALLSPGRRTVKRRCGSWTWTRARALPFIIAC